MLATSARMVPDIALAWFELPSALNTICSPSFFTSTLGSAERARVPSGPLMEICPEATFSSTPFGSGTGYLAILDMIFSGNDAKHFTADAVGARLAVGHHAARGGQDRHAEPVHDARTVVASLVHAQPGLGHPLQTLDHRLAGVVLERDGKLLVAAVLAQRKVLDIAFVLEDLGDRALQLGGRHHRLGMPDHLGVADTDQHVRDRIAHAHRPLLTLTFLLIGLSSSLYQLALITPGISPFKARSRSLLRPRPNLLYTPRGRPVSAQRLRSLTGDASRGSFCSLARASSRASSEA